MQIVIDIPEDRYDEIHSLNFVMYGLQSEENKQLFYRLINAVQDGTVLSEPHGRLIDADVLKKTIQENDVLYMRGFNVRLCDINNTPTILEATKESTDADSERAGVCM